MFARVGELGYFMRDIGRGLKDPATYGSETIRQMRNIGVDSLPLAAIVAAFIGAVTAFQTRYQLFGGVQLSVVGLISRQSIILELGPLLTGLVLTGRVGARITAEIGTMRVTEQIDALEASAVDSFKFLVVTRVVACVIALPLLTSLMNFTGMLGGFAAETSITGIPLMAYMRQAFALIEFSDLIPSTIKTAVFGFIIAVVAAYLGINTSSGTEGVGRASTRAVVTSSITLIVANVVLVRLIFFFYPG